MSRTPRGCPGTRRTGLGRRHGRRSGAARPPRRRATRCGCRSTPASFADRGDGAPCLILQAQDISARRSAEAQLQHIAFHDSLTGLANRARFHEQPGAGDRAQRRPIRRARFAVMYLDFDRFKLINDTLGHSVGDEFLVHGRAAHRAARAPERHGGAAGRRRVRDPARRRRVARRMTMALAERLQDALREPLSGRRHRGQHQRQHRHHLQHRRLPHARRGAARRRHRDVPRQGRPAGALRAVRRRAAIAGVRPGAARSATCARAIDDDQLMLAYQPIYDLIDGRIVGFEALVRWQHPERGTVDPDIFVPVAEESGLIGALTEHILARACRQLRLWQPARWRQPPPAHAGQPFGSGPEQQRTRHAGGHDPADQWPGGLAADAGDHRKQADDRIDRRDGYPDAPARHRRGHQRRRLRHRLLIAVVPVDAADLQPEDRPLVRAPDGQGREGHRDREGRGRPGQRRSARR